MNNNTEIQLGEKKYNITFGMTSFFTLANKSQERNDNNFVRHAANIIYSGIDNWCVVNEKPSPKYGEIYEAVDAEFAVEDGATKLADIMEFHRNTTAGTKLYGSIEETKKKV